MPTTGLRQLKRPRTILLLVLLLCACSTSHQQATTPTPAPAATATPDEAQQAARIAWQSGPHADTYALEKGPNTYCARCHAPANWDPAAVIDPAPNCVSCKFPFEAEPRQAAGNPLVPEEEWENIGCQVCHPVRNGVVSPDIAWWDVPTGYYETVSGTTVLCEQCHADQGQINHQRPLGQAAHTDFTCTDCHDPHSTVASCSQAGCHPEQARPWPAPEPAAQGTALAHTDLHANINCAACHDAAGLELGPVEEGGPWMPFRQVVVLERASSQPYQSHQLQREVDCSRCHFAGNPWDLEPYDDSS